MAKVFKLRRGTTDDHAAFTGAIGEVTMDTDKKTLVVHDGSKAGGYPLQREDQSSSSSVKLANKRTIDGVQFDGSANATHYASCSTAAGTAEKVVSLSNFALATGAWVAVRFTVTNTAANPTLNVNSTGAKAIRYRNSAISAGYLAANRTYLFVYDGSYYQLVGDIDTNTTYSVASQEEAEAGTNNTKMMSPLRVKQAIDALSAPACPTGMVAYFALTAVPSGWLLCNGSNVSRTTYAALFAAIGTKFGSGDGSSTFTLPNLNERFIEGTTTTSKVGTKLEAGLPNITGEYTANYLDTENDAAVYVGALFSARKGSLLGTSGSLGKSNVIGFDASKSSSAYGNSSTIQPEAIQMLPCIKS